MQNIIMTKAQSVIVHLKLHTPVDICTHNKTCTQISYERKGILTTSPEYLPENLTS